MDNKALCRKHGVTVHRVGAAFTCWPDGSPIPAADLDKFLVATPADVFDEKLVDSIPLAETYDEAQAFAVKYLDLKFDEKDFRPKYIRYTDSASASVVHASVPVEGSNTQVECEALCGTLIYPPDEGDPDPEFLQDGAVDCVKCKTVLEALSCIRAPELIVEVMHTHYRTTRDPEADRKWRRSLGLPEDVTAS